MNRAYEMMVLVKPEVEVTEKSAKAIVENMLGELAVISDITLWGKKKLAYPIQKLNEAHYILVKLTHPKLSVHEIEKKVQLGTEVIRYVITKSK